MLCESLVYKWESLLKEEAAKFEQLHHKFMKEKTDHLQGLKGLRSIYQWFFHLLLLISINTVSKFEEGKERLYMRYEQQKGEDNDIGTGEVLH
ncbi:unnamed protein product [Brassica rapa subsp. trilocularis]